MNILNKYIGKTIIGSVLTVLLILLGIESFLELASELKDVGKGSFHFWQALMNVPLMLPTDMYELFPMAALIGSLLGLGKLANQSELIVMSAAGMSRFQIICAMLQAAALLLVVVSFVGEGIAPKAQQYAKDSKTIAISAGKTLKTASGVWFRDGSNFIFVRDILLGNHLYDVTRYKFDAQKKLSVISHADHGIYEKGGWYFHQVIQSEIMPDQIKSHSFEVQKWDINVDKRLLGISNIRTDQMSLPKLYSYIRYRQQNDLGAGLYEFAFWKRLIQPFATIVMIFLAVPFIFGPLRSVSMGLRIVTGVIIGFSFYILNQFFGPISQVYQIPVLIAAFLPTVTFAMLGGFLLFLKA
ncbi:MAG: LPS export ABC transporter permease LptG [Gammaproteobacteria bacterium]|nr:LPS export ABC transporter permease LptG [Gammaproteobacteria bacterium]